MSSGSGQLGPNLWNEEEEEYKFRFTHFLNMYSEDVQRLIPKIIRIIHRQPGYISLRRLNKVDKIIRWEV